ncbi:uncharacterized protein [Nicotiana tomentosiformis]|uniref:uncharacterized protein n=1 Tax=Nicotiana tomentosiformis TaxID=4098 RepID=UPI00388C6B3B
MGYRAYILVGERPLAADVQTLANQFVRLDASESSRVLACTVARSSLYERIRERQYDDPYLLVLKDTVWHGGAKQVVMGEDGILWMQGGICVPNVDGLRELILEEAHSSRLAKSAHFNPVAVTNYSERLAEIYIREIVRLHGVPVSIISDLSTQFASYFWRVVQRELGTWVELSTTFHPQSDGQSERTIQIL